MNKKHISLLGIFLLYISVAVAQKKPCNYRLDLNITQNDKPVINAEVFLEKEHRLEHSNELGQVHFEKICDSVVEIEIQAQNVHEHYQLNIAKPIPYAIVLTTAINQNSVIIRVPNEQPHVNVNIESKSIQSFAAAIQNLPNVQFISTGRTISKPMLQGMIGLRVPILMDGMRLQGQSWGLDHSPELGATGTEKITLMRGVDAIVEASDAWGGVVSVENQHSFQKHEVDVKQRLSYQTNGGVMQVNGILQSGQSPSKKIEKNSGKSNGTYIKYLAQVSRDYATPLGILANTASQELMFAAGQTIHMKPGSLRIHGGFYQFISGIYLGSHIGNLTDLQQAINSEKPLRTTENSRYQIEKPRQETQQIHLQSEWNAHALNGLKVQFNYQQNLRQEYDPHRNTSVNFPQLDVFQQSTSLKFEKPQSFEYFNLKNGIQFTYQNQTFGGYYFIPEYQSLQESVYSKIEIKPNDHESRHAFIWRLDLLQRNGNHWFNTVKNQFNEDFFGFSGGYSWTWKLAQIDVLQIWRAPGLNELYSKGVHHGSASYEQGNPNLKPESGQKINFSIEIPIFPKHIRSTYTSKLGGFCKINFNGFSQLSQNFIHLFPLPQPILTVRGAFPAFEYKQLPTFYAGAEMNLEASWMFKNNRKIQLVSKANLLYATILSNNHYPPLIPCPTLTSTLNYSWKEFAISISHKIQFKQPFYTAQTDFSPPPPTFQLWGMNLKFPKFGKSKSFTLILSTDNLMNTVYRDYLDRFRYFTPMPGRNFGLQLIYHLHHHNKHSDKQEITIDTIL
jgi:iron complex outermembrane receptor protein